MTKITSFVKNQPYLRTVFDVLAVISDSFSGSWLYYYGRPLYYYPNEAWRTAHGHGDTRRVPGVGQEDVGYGVVVPGVMGGGVRVWVQWWVPGMGTVVGTVVGTVGTSMGTVGTSMVGLNLASFGLNLASFGHILAIFGHILAIFSHI